MTTRLSVAVACALGLAMCAPKTAVAPRSAPPPRASEGTAAAAELQALPAPDTRPPCRLEGCCPGRGDTAYVQSDFLVICADGLPSDLCDCHGADGIQENQSEPVNASGR